MRDRLTFCFEHYLLRMNDERTRNDPLSYDA